MKKWGSRAGLPFKDDLPLVRSSTLRASGAITLQSKSVIVSFGEVQRELRVVHTLFPPRGPEGRRGSWSDLICQGCERRARTLRFYQGRAVCRLCHGLLKRAEYRDLSGVIERLRDPTKVKRRVKREIHLRRILVAERQKWLRNA